MATKDEGINPFAKYVPSQQEENPFARFVAPQPEQAEAQQPENPFAKYVAPAPKEAPKEEPKSEGFTDDMFETIKGLFGQSKYQKQVPEGDKNEFEKQLGYLGTDVQVGLKNTKFALQNLADAEKLGLAEDRIKKRLEKYGSLDTMPEEERIAQIKDEEKTASILRGFAAQGKEIQDIKDTYGQRAAATRYAAMRQSPEYQKADTLSQLSMIGQQFLQDPLGMLATTVVDTGLQSLPTSMGVAATAILARYGLMSPTAAAVVGGGASGMSEFGNAYADLRAQGKSHEDAWHDAGVKSGVIGAFDAASFKSAGKAADVVMDTFKHGAKQGIFQTAKQVGKEVGKETGRQAAYGGAGEALGSAAIGQPIDPASVLDEMMGEIISAPLEARATYKQQTAAAAEPKLPTPEEAAKAKGFLQGATPPGATTVVPPGTERIAAAAPAGGEPTPLTKRAEALAAEYGIHIEDAYNLARDEIKEAQGAERTEPGTSEPSVPVSAPTGAAVPTTETTEAGGLGGVSAPTGVPTGREGTEPSALTAPAAPAEPATPTPKIEQFPRVDAIPRFPMGPTSITPKVVAEGKPLYHETNVEGIRDLLRNEQQFEYQPIFVTDNPDIALGQGANRGVHVVFRPDSISGQENVKPGTGALAGREYKSDVIAKNAIQSIIFDDEKALKQVRGLPAQVLKSGFVKETLPDGRIQFTRPEFAVEAPVVEEAVAEAPVVEEPTAETPVTEEAVPAEAPVVEEAPSPLARTGKRGRPAKLTPEEKATRTAEQQKAAGESRDRARQMDRLAAYIAEPFDGAQYDTDEGAAEAERIFVANQNIALEEAVAMLKDPAHRKNKAGKTAEQILSSVSPERRAQAERNYNYKKEHNLPIGRPKGKAATVGATSSLDLAQSTDGTQNETYNRFNTASAAIQWIMRNGNAFEKALAARLRPFLNGVKLVVVNDINQVPADQRAEFRTAHGLYYNTTRTGPVIYLSGNTGINNTTFLHEALHGATFARIQEYYNALADGRRIDPRLRAAVQDLQAIMAEAAIHYEKLATQFGEGQITDPKMQTLLSNMLAFADAGAFDDLHEFLAYGMSHPVFQEFLGQVPGQVRGLKMDSASGLTRFVQAIRKMFNMDENTQSALQDLIVVSDALLSSPLDAQAVTGAKAAKVNITPEGERAEELVRNARGKQTTVKENFIKRSIKRFGDVMDGLNESQKLNNSWKAAIFGKLQNIASFDRAFNNRLRAEFLKRAKEGDMTMKEVEKSLLRISVSQALHRGNLANSIIDRGGYQYDPTTNRWTAVDAEANLVRLESVIKALADRLGVDANRAREIMGTAFEVNRLNSFIQERNTKQATLTQVNAAISALQRTKNRTDAQNRDLKTKMQISRLLEQRIEELELKGRHKSDAEVAEGMKLFTEFPEIAEGAQVWDQMRQMAINMMAESGVWSQRKAEAYLDDSAYVPFFRTMEEETTSGPRIMQGGIRESNIERKQKGSERELADPVGNMVQWMRWSIARAVSNTQLQVMLDQYKAALPDEVVEGEGPKNNTFIVYREGVPRKYSVADPAVAQAFTGMENVVFPGIAAAAKISNTFRHAITRIPIFPMGQLIMDSYTAMFTSGVRKPGALLLEIAKEVGRTARQEVGPGGYRSMTRDQLQRAGILETRQYAALSEEEALHYHLHSKGVHPWHALMNFLDRFAAASDNVIRQGVYNQSLKEGASKEVAMERAAEIVNFRRQSGNPVIRFFARIIPFFNAYLQILDVSIRTITGKSVSPTERKAAIATFIATNAKIAALSFLYSAVVGDDEDYQRKSRVVRDRMFMIPGTGGMGVPIRTDVFALPKIIGEYGYQILADKGYTDSRMLKKALSNALINTVSPPGDGIPQIARPLIEVKANHDFFQDRPIVPAGMERIEPEYQYNKNTSEMAKAIGAFGGFSPMKVDHLLRGYFGSVATLTMMATNDLIAKARGEKVTAPEKNVIDYVSKLPGMSGFVSRPENTAVMSDFYEVYQDVSKANATLASLESRPEEYSKYLAKHEKEIAYKHMVNALHNSLSKLTEYEKKIRAIPDSEMSPAEKRKAIDEVNARRDAFHARVLAIRKGVYE